MRILDKYIIREFLKVFGLCLAGFILVFLLVEITDKVKYYFEYNPPAYLMLKYFLVKLPGYLFFGIPLSILLGGMLSLLMLARNSEIIAMQANGVDALAIARPVLTVGLAASFIMFAANETLIPWSNRYSEFIQNVEIAKKPDITYVKQDEIWMRTRNSIIHVKKFDKQKMELEQISVLNLDPDYELLERIYADKGKWWNDTWVVYGVNRTIRNNGKFNVETLPFMNIELDKTPADLARVERNTKEMNLTQLSDYIDKLQSEGISSTRLDVDWHNKPAFPLVCVIMACLSVPFAVKMNPRSGGVAVGLGLSILIAFSYWIVHTVFIALGHGGYLPPIVSAWATNVIFGFLALYLLLRAGT